jgi:phospholipase C
MGRSRNGPPRWSPTGMTRRDALRGAGTVGLGFVLGNCSGTPSPGSRPDPSLPEGADTIPQIEHVVILMMENHSFDNYFGMLDPAVGLSLSGGRPVVSCPDASGNRIQAFHMPSTCQLDSLPTQAWNASHIAYADGRNDGFVLSSGPVAMGYFTAADIPFYYGLARTFPLASRWFCSTLCQTYPNRRFLMAGTAAGIITTSDESLTAPPPPNGNIFERLDAHGIRWANYHSDLPSLAILPDYAFKNTDRLLPVAQFFTDAASGNLPAVSLVDPAFNGGSEENPDDIQVGEQFAAQVISAVLTGPAWSKTLLVWLYDEHGGYYDHVVPPPAIAPDDIPPDLTAGDLPGGYNRYGFRVPAVIVSPYARPNYVSSVVRDHTAILKFIERKWNLAALTHRDANADDLLDCLDFRSPPAFLVPPRLPAPALGKSRQPTCTPGDPGPIPSGSLPFGALPPAGGVAGPLARIWRARMPNRNARPR